VEPFGFGRLGIRADSPRLLPFLSARPPARPTSAAPPAIAGTFALSAIFEIVDVSFCCEPLLRLGFRAPELDELREPDRDRLLPARDRLLPDRDPPSLERDRLLPARDPPLPEREPLERVLRELELRELEVFVWAISASLLRRRRAVPNPVPHHHYPAYCS
jgi:hypothetical protein